MLINPTVRKHQVDINFFTSFAVDLCSFGGWLVIIFVDACTLCLVVYFVQAIERPFVRPTPLVQRGDFGGKLLVLQLVDETSRIRKMVKNTKKYHT